MDNVEGPTRRMRSDAHGRGALLNSGKAMKKTFMLLLCLGLQVTVGDADTSFSYYQFSGSSNSLSVLGDARIYIDDLALELTTTGAGRATYDVPIQFVDASSQTTTSFETTFIFSIEPDSSVPQSYGEGLTFSISSENSTVGDAGAYLGLVKASSATTSSTTTSQSKYFALEFDIHQDAQFQDINNNHVGVDLNSLISTQSKVAQADTTLLTLASGDHIMAWVTYNSSTHILEVSISAYTHTTYPKPTTPLLSVPVDLSTVLDEYMFVGFSAATGSGTVRHKVWSWTFRTTTVDSTGQPVPPSDVLAPSPSPGGSTPAGTSGADRLLGSDDRFTRSAYAGLLVVSWFLAF